MELRQLQCFVTVAEELHFRRAGERLGISQSALSANLAALEAELGYSLFFRTTRHVSLTQAGAVFLPDVRKILSETGAAVTRARKAAEGAAQAIRVGGVDEAVVSILPRVIAAFKRDHPDCHVSVQEISSSSRTLGALESHRTDVAFLREAVKTDFIDSRFLYRQEMLVAMATDTRPSGKVRLITPDELAEMPIIGFPRHARPILHDMLISSLRNVGKQPDIACEAIDKSTMLQLVRQGVGAALVPAWVRNLAPEGVAFCRYDDPERFFDLHVAFRKAEVTPVLSAFLDLVEAHATSVGDENLQ